MFFYIGTATSPIFLGIHNPYDGARFVQLQWSQSQLELIPNGFSVVHVKFVNKSIPCLQTGT